MFKKNLFKSIFTSVFLIGFIISLANADVQNVRIGYCEDNGKNLQDDSKLIEIQPGEQKEICLNISNGEPNDVNVIYGFTKGFLNDAGAQLCNSNIEEENEFMKLFSNDNGNIRNINLKQGETKTIKEKITVPIGMSGMFYGCMLHKIATPDTNKMFQIVAMVKRSLNLFIGGNGEIKNSIKLIKTDGDVFSSNNKIGARSDENNKITLNFSIKNDGNVGQNIKINGTLYNALGLEKTFEIATVLVGPGAEMELNSNPILLPTYKGLFNVSSSIEAEPVFIFNADNIDDEFKKTTTMEESTKIFIFSWLWIVAGLVILLILIMLLRPLFKKHKTE
ncbi:hypothetical protein K9M48_01745 [Candidatus Gracilibacteria bacterium]|nr:hypothetical protein [Candidatus Gracilibacteria bacterium]